MLCTSGFMDNVVRAHDDQQQATQLRRILKVTQQRQHGYDAAREQHRPHRGRSLLVPLACLCRSAEWQSLSDEQKKFVGQADKEDGEFW